MAITCVTGNTTTVTVPGDLSLSVISIGSYSKSYSDINASTLATTGHELLCPSDLATSSEIPVTIAFDTGEAETNLSSTLGVAGTITILFASGQHITGTGYVKSHGWDNVQNNERIEGTVTLQFDGETAPGYATPV